MSLQVSHIHSANKSSCLSEGDTGEQALHISFPAKKGKRSHSALTPCSNQSLTILGHGHYCFGPGACQRPHEISWPVIWRLVIFALRVPVPHCCWLIVLSKCHGECNNAILSFYLLFYESLYPPFDLQHTQGLLQERYSPTCDTAPVSLNQRCGLDFQTSIESVLVVLPHMPS